MLRPEEQLDDLGRGLKIIQKKKGFKYGTDSVLLAKFMLMSSGVIPGKGRCKVCVDLGTGTGILPILISRDNRFSKIYGLEIQQSYAEMACRSVELNKLEDKIEIVCDDIKKVTEIYGKAAVQVVLSNPPYKKADTGIQNSGESETIARHEVCCTLEDVIKGASEILEPGGAFFMVNRPERMADAIEYMRRYKLEPKLIRMVQPKVTKQPSMFLVAAVKNARSYLRVMPSLILMEEDGTNTSELEKIYEY